MKTGTGDDAMEEKTTRPILTDDTVVEDKEVPFEDLISELRY
jgi:hypothetical protein